MARTAAWQRKEGKSKSGGLNRKGIASYRAKNPGSKLRGPAGGPAPKKKKMRTGGQVKKDTHVTKEGKTAKKGLWYNIHQKRKRGGKMRKPGAKGAPTAAAIKRSQGRG